MRVATPGLRFADSSASPVVGGGARGQVAIVIAKYYATQNVGRWFPGLRYDVLLVDSLHTLYGLPTLAGSGSGGPASIELNELDVADPQALKRLQAGQLGDLGALGGAWVVLDELAGGIPVISSTILTPGTRTSRMLDNAASPDDDVDTTPDGIGDMAANAASQIADLIRSAEPDADNGEVLIASLVEDGAFPAEEAKFPGVPPATTALESDSEGRGDAYFAGWSRGVLSAYLGTAYGAYITLADVSGDIPDAVLLPMPTDADSEGDAAATQEANGVLRNAYVSGFRKGWGKGSDLAAKYPRAPDVAASAEPEPDSGVEPTDPADESDSDNGLVSVTAKGAARFLEQGGTRVVHTRDGHYRVDARNGGGEVRFQGGNGGVKSVANGAQLEVGNGESKVNATADAVRLGSKTGTDQSVAVWDSGVKDLLTYVHSTLSTMLVDLQALGKATTVPTPITTMATTIALLKSRIDADYAASDAVTATKGA